MEPGTAVPAADIADPLSRAASASRGAAEWGAGQDKEPWRRRDTTLCTGMMGDVKGGRRASERTGGGYG